MRILDIINEAIGGRVLGGFTVKPIADIPNDNEQTTDEAIGLNAPHRVLPKDELVGYVDRIKSGTKTKKDRVTQPYIHEKSIKITKSDNGEDLWDLDDLARQITRRPTTLLDTNAKMSKSATEGEIVYDLTLPALKGIVVDEANGDFVEITTCPQAGECQLFCYARKGGYIMFPESSMSAARALNFLVNDPEGYTALINKEIQQIKGKIAKVQKKTGSTVQLVVRWHDAGDFFSKEYLDLAYGVAESNPDVKFYAYTKVADAATGAHPANFLMNFSSGAKRSQSKKIEIHRAAGNTVKQGITVPKDMFYDLIDRTGIKLNKDEKGRTQFKSPQAFDVLKQRLADKFNLDVNSIISYDQMMATPEGPTPKWNVIVQPGAGDRGANRLDVINSFLMYH